jgi:hypothetical protein
MPREPTFQTLHIASVAFNSLLLGEIFVPDWDVFQVILLSRYFSQSFMSENVNELSSFILILNCFYFRASTRRLSSMLQQEQSVVVQYMLGNAPNLIEFLIFLVSLQKVLYRLKKIIYTFQIRCIIVISLAIMILKS